MVQRHEAALNLLLSLEQLAEAVEPAMTVRPLGRTEMLESQEVERLRPSQAALRAVLSSKATEFLGVPANAGDHFEAANLTRRMSPTGRLPAYANSD